MSSANAALLMSFDVDKSNVGKDARLVEVYKEHQLYLNIVICSS